MHVRVPRLRRSLAGLTSVALALAVVTPAAALGATHAAPKAAVAHTVTYDNYSFSIDGKRTFLWSGEFHYFRLPSPGEWRDILEKMKAGGFNAVSIYFDWAYHSPKQGVYDFSGVRNVDKLLDIAAQVGIYVIARPGPYINAEVDAGGFPDWLTQQQGRARSGAPDYLAASDEWLSHIDPILARHQLTNGTGTVILYQVENEFYDSSAPARDYMTHLENKARADGITVPLTGNNNGTFNTGQGALDVDGPDSYPQGFNCSTPTVWRPVDNISYDHPAGKPLYSPEYQGGAFDPWGGPGYDQCRVLTGPDFERVFYKNNIAVGATAMSFYMTYGGTSWGWQSDPNQVYTSYDYGAPIKEDRELSAKYNEDKLIGYFTQSVAPLTKTDPLGADAPSEPAILDTARINPDDGTQFHTLRHADSTATSTDTTHISLDLNAHAGYTHDDADTSALQYTGAWTHVGAEQSYTGGDYQHTESFSNTAGDSVTIPFTGTAVRWVSGRDTNHGIADIYLDGTKVDTVDTYGATKATQQVLYSAQGLPAGAHTLKIVVTGTKNAAASGTFISIDAVDVPSGTAASYPVVPQQPGTAITLAGRDSKVIVANYAMDHQQLQYSTSEIMTHASMGGRDVALLYGESGQSGETVLHYAVKPTVKVLAGSVAHTWDAARGDLRLNYTHAGLAQVLITPAGGTPLQLLLATTAVAAQFWTQSTSAGPVLVRGPYLLRTAKASGHVLALTGDLSKTTKLDVVAAPAGLTKVTWNGKAVANPSSTRLGSLLGTAPGPKPVTLPALTGWRHIEATPEAQPGFDDGRWQLADHPATTNPTAPTAPPVLYADDYGFHHGDVWYRGRFTAQGAETGINVSAITGRAGVYSVWLNGVFLGSNPSGGHRFTFPPGALRTGENVVSVLVEDMGHNEDYNAQDSHKEPRGLTSVSLVGSTSQIGWRIQGNLGGENLVDPVRGSFNVGGQYGERTGYYLPGFPDSSWAPVSLPTADTTPGTSWYRTTVTLDLPKTQDVPLGITIADDPSRHYRALIFVNGWQVGRYLNDTGPQHTFPVQPGILNTHGKNTIAISVWNQDGTTGGLGTVSLQQYGNYTTSLKVPQVASPGFRQLGFAAASPDPSTGVVSVSAPDTITRGGSGLVTATLRPAGNHRLFDASLDVVLPSGWTAVAQTPTTQSQVRPGQSLTASWQVTAPAGDQPGAAPVTVHASYTVNTRADSADATTTVRVPAPPPTGTQWVSDLPFTSTNGWGPVERDTSNGEQAAGDGKPITINGVVYAKGLGTNSTADITMNLGANCSHFTAAVGVDDEVGSSGSVTFSVLADGVPVYTSPVLTGADPAATVDVSLAGAQQLDLVTGDGGDGNGLDHGDWGAAQLVCAG